MDTSRIVINTIDNSTSLIESSTAVTGFTVVKAEKGPATPIRISAGGAATLKDIFGVSSKEYPEMFEVETFNKEYDTWVSAPYTNATIPVSYVTPDGVFAASDKVTYSDNVEKLINGEIDPEVDTIDIPGITSVTNPKILLDTRYAKSNNVGRNITHINSETQEVVYDYVASDLDSKNYGYPSYFNNLTVNVLKEDTTGEGEKYYTLETASKKGLKINVGLPKQLFNFITLEEVRTGTGDDATVTTTQKDNLLFDSFRLSGLTNTCDFGLSLKTKTYKEGTTSKTLTKCYVIDGEKEIGEIGYFNENDGKLYDWDSITGSTTPYINLYMIIYGNSDSDYLGTFTESYVQNFLDEDEERAVLNTYFISKYCFMNDLVEITVGTSTNVQHNPIPLTDEHIYGVILPKYPSERKMHISFSGFSKLTNYTVYSAESRNILKMTVYEEGAFHDASHPISITGSLNKEAVDANGSYIGFTSNNSEYANQNLIYVYPRNTFKKGDIFNKQLSAFVPVDFIDGTREFNEYFKTRDTEIVTGKVYYIKSTSGEFVVVENPTVENIGNYYENDYDCITLHDYGWEKALENEYGDVDVFFDSSIHKESLSSLSESKYFELASADVNSHELAGYFFNYTLANPVLDNTYQLTFGRNYWNVCNEGIIDLNKTGDRILSPMTGASALMQCRIIENRCGGIAPMWENSGTPSMGGQLNMISVYKLKYKYTKDQLDILDELNYNPIVNDRQYGLMRVGQKTCKSGDITDWSYIGHACSFLNFIKEIKENVMIPQIGKANNPYYRMLRKEQVEQYLAKRLEGNNRIWAEAEVDTSTTDGVNDIYAMKARKFVINVRVKVDIYSEKVELNFTNEDQATTINAN